MLLGHPMTDREAALAKELSEVKGRLEQALDTVEALEKENTLLRQKIGLLIRRVFGASSEKLDPAQMELLLGMASSEAGAGKTGASPELGEAALLSCKDPSRPAHPRGHEPRWPADLQVIEQVVEPAEVKAAPQAWRCIGEEVSEQLIVNRRASYAGRSSGASSSIAANSTPCLSSPRCRRSCRIAASPCPACWHKSSWQSIAITFPSTGRSKSTGRGTACIFPGRRWLTGSAWQPAG